MPSPAFSAPGADFIPGARLMALYANLQRPRVVVKRLGLMLLGRSQKAFREQTDRDAPFLGWPPRAVPNVLGILADLTAGINPPPNRWAPTPSGVDKGTLRDTLASSVETDDTVKIGSTTGYGGRVQYGDEVDVTLDDDLKGKIKAYLDKEGGKATRAEKAAKKAENDAYGYGPHGGDYARATTLASRAAAKVSRASDLERSFGWMLNPKTRGFSYEVPPRHFLGVNNQDVADMEEVIAEEIVKQGQT